MPDAYDDGRVLVTCPVCGGSTLTARTGERSWRCDGCGRHIEVHDEPIEVFTENYSAAMSRVSAQVARLRVLRDRLVAEEAWPETPTLEDFTDLLIVVLDQLRLLIVVLDLHDQLRGTE